VPHAIDSTGVVVNQIELGMAFEAIDRVVELPQGEADLLARRFIEHCVKFSERRRVPRREQSHFVTYVDESIREVRDDKLDAAVTLRRHRKPRRAQDSDLHRRTKEPAVSPAPELVTFVVATSCDGRGNPYRPARSTNRDHRGTCRRGTGPRRTRARP
jgi:hypothetical protein